MSCIRTVSEENTAAVPDREKRYPDFREINEYESRFSRSEFVEKQPGKNSWRKAGEDGKHMKTKFNRERVRFDIKQPDTLVIQGWFEEEQPEQAVFEAFLDGKETELTVQTQSGVEVTKKYLRYKTNVEQEYFLRIPLGNSAGNLKVFWKNGETRVPVYHASSASLARLKQHLESWMEQLRVLPDGRYQLRGWYMGCEHAQIAVLDGSGTPLGAACTEQKRMDILGEFPEAVPDETHGFELTFEAPKENHLRLALKGGGKKVLYLVNCKKMLSGKEDLATICKKSMLYLKRKGLRQFTRRVSDVLLGSDSISYERWRRKYGTKPSELVRQREVKFAYAPKISIVIPLYRTPEHFLREVIRSVEEQTYPNWELVLSDGSGEHSPLDGFLDELEHAYAKKAEKLKIVRNKKQLRIAENTNAALAEATGDFIAFGDHDDLFAPDALYECVKILQEKPETALLYTDEDKVDGKGKKYFQPHFKSDYNPDLLCSMNYFCHLVVVKRELLDAAGTLDPAYDGAQDYDFVLRCTEHTKPEQIVHIPKILYHWRTHQDSTAENPESKRYAFTAGCRAVQAHYDRLGIRATVHEGAYPGLYETDYEIIGKPLISILIPNKDHLADLTKCIDSIERLSDYKNYEYIIIENNSTEPETFEGYKKLEAENAKIHVVYYKGDFNYSAINNFGAAHAKGDYFLLLNNDTELIREDDLRQLLGVCQRKDVGIVGARLYYEDDTIQHAGVVLGFGGIAGHAFIGQSRSDNGYFSQIICMRDYSAVTAACMMVKAAVYREVGGLSEHLKVAFNDIDFCMKVREKGYLVVYNPRAELYHYESKSRGLENTQEKIERFNGEVAQFLSRWGDQVKAGDPYYNPNLSLDKADFSLKL